MTIDEKVVITAAKFAASTGRLPDQDDLERCNCELAGSIMHSQCGWDAARDMPAFILGQSAYAELAAELERANELADKYKWQVRDTCVRAEKAESQLAEERELRMSLESSWQQAEAQLAELRVAPERFVRDAEEVDLGGGDAVVTTCESLELAKSTLAAADGGA